MSTVGKCKKPAAERVFLCLMSHETMKWIGALNIFSYYLLDFGEMVNVCIPETRWLFNKLVSMMLLGYDCNEKGINSSDRFLFSWLCRYEIT